MSFEIYRTTAEHIIGAIDAALQMKEGVDSVLVAQFLDTQEDFASRALSMAEQLGLLSGNNAGQFVPHFPYAVYLITSSRLQKAAILRLVLEEYPPYKTFKSRLAVEELAPKAAMQTRTIHSISADRDDIASTLINLGTYAGSLISEGAGLYRPAEGDPIDYLAVVGEIIQDRMSTKLHLAHRMGPEAVDWIDQQEVFDHLVTAYQRLAQIKEDPNAPIVHAANAVESFLSQLAAHCGVDVKNAHGINAKADCLFSKRNLEKKHKFMLKYLGAVRNAADHGIDPDINHTWDISQNTAIEYVFVAQSVIVDLVAYVQGRFVV